MTEKQDHIPVFFEGCDDLIDILATSMASICYNTKSFIDFYILDCGIHEFNKKQLLSMKEIFHNFSIEFIPIDLSRFKELKGYTEKNFIDCYSRLLIPELKKELKKAIYLDSDTISLKDIKEFWNENLDNKSLGVIPDLGYRIPVKKRFVEKLKGNPNQLYISGGVWIVNCEKWRKNKVTEALIKLAYEKKDNLCYIIEDLFSLYFSEDYKLLDSRYAFIELDNYAEDIPISSITSEYLENELKNVSILHLAGQNKMWKSPYNIFKGRIHSHFNNFWFFAKMTPFYEGMQNRFLYFIIENVKKTSIKEHNRKTIKLFNLIPFLTVKTKKAISYYKLFGFIPLFKVKDK